MDPGDAAWWWQYGLDGGAGAVVGAAATGWAVWLTLRHERRQSLKTTVEDAVANLQAVALMRAGSMNASIGAADDHVAGLLAVQAAAFQVTGRAARRWPGFVTALLGHLELLMELPKTAPHDTSPTQALDLLAKACGELGATAGTWLIDHEAFEPKRWELRKRRALRQ